MVRQAGVRNLSVVMLQLAVITNVGEQLELVLATRLPGYKVTRLPGYLQSNQVTKLPGYLVTRLPGYQVTKLPGYQVTRLPGYQVTRLLNLPSENMRRYCFHSLLNLWGSVCLLVMIIALVPDEERLYHVVN